MYYVASVALECRSLLPLIEDILRTSPSQFTPQHKQVGKRVSWWTTRWTPFVPTIPSGQQWKSKAVEMASILPCSLRRAYLPSFQLPYCYAPCRFDSGQSIDDQTRWKGRCFRISNSLINVPRSRGLVASQADMQSTVSHHRGTVSTQIGSASLIDAPSVCCITDTRDHRSSNAESSRHHRNKAFVALEHSKSLRPSILLIIFSLLHNNLGHCKSTNRMAPPGLIRYFCRNRSCTGCQELVAGSGGTFESKPQSYARPGYARAKERHLQPQFLCLVELVDLSRQSRQFDSPWFVLSRWAYFVPVYRRASSEPVGFQFVLVLRSLSVISIADIVRRFQR